jgi:SAM-dependent methyltransferase
MGVIGKLRELRWRAAGHYSRPLPDAFIAPVRDRAVLEIGGPSALFGTGGLLPLYPQAASVDGVQWTEDTIWHGRQRGAYAPDGNPTGVVHIVDGATLEGIPDASYDAVISSHVIEHLANPLRGLQAWRRVTRPGGAIVLVAPHKAGTFDHRRPVTPLAHLIEDYERGVGEDDLTHLEETLALHDRSRDAEGDDAEAWARLRRENLAHRVLHHHVFTTLSLVELLAHAGIAVDAVETRFPHDVYVAGRFAGAPAAVDSSVLGPALRASPFSVDREVRLAAAATPSASVPAGAR